MQIRVAEEEKITESPIDHPESKNTASTGYSAVNILRRLEDTLQRAPNVVSALIPNTSLVDAGVFLAELLIPYTSDLVWMSEILSTMTKGKVPTVANARNKLHRYLSLPEDFLAEISFIQNDFIQHVNRIVPNIQLSPQGVCYGLMMMWYIHQRAGKDFLAELKAIEQASDFNNEQIKLLEFIKSIQDSQDSIKKEKMFIYALKAGANFAKTLDEIAEKILEQIEQYPNSLIEIRPGNALSSHAVGFAKQGAVLKYFDPNFREVSFQHADAAKQSIIYLLKYAYKNYFAIEMQRSSIFINVYQMNLVPDVKLLPAPQSEFVPDPRRDLRLFSRINRVEQMPDDMPMFAENIYTLAVRN